MSTHALPTRGTSLALHGVGKVYRAHGRDVIALENVTLELGATEFVSIVGHSGCGKSTLLRLAAGLDRDHSGKISFDGHPVTGPSLERGIIFQEHRLFPWLTVAQNVALAVHHAGLAPAGKQALVQSRIDLVGLTGFERAFPHQLSGGMSQRVAIARALTGSPRLLLLDEPFGALDAFNRLYIQQELQKIWQQQRLPMLLVTHDVEEAIFLSDRVVVMSPRPGRIQRIVDVRLPHPRDRTSAEFVAVKRVLLDELGYHAARAPGRAAA